jgi:hypothetical protein
MPEQIQITLFTFDELSEESQQRVIEPFREAYDPDYSVIYDEFINGMSVDYGAVIQVDDIQWSGFWSQGDGACFTCDFDTEVILPMLKEELNEDQVALLKEIDAEIDCSSIRTGYQYSHENTVRGKVSINYGDTYYDRMVDINEIHDILENKLTEIIREECRNLYSELERFYDEEMEDEAIIQKLKEYSLLHLGACRYREDGTLFVR